VTGNQQPGDLAGACLKRSKSSKELVGDVKNPVELQRGYINAEKGFLGSSFVKRVRSHPLRESNWTYPRVRSRPRHHGLRSVECQFHGYNLTQEPSNFIFAVTFVGSAMNEDRTNKIYSMVSLRYLQKEKGR